MAGPGPSISRKLGKFNLHQQSCHGKTLPSCLLTLSPFASVLVWQLWVNQRSIRMASWNYSPVSVFRPFTTMKASSRLHRKTFKTRVLISCLVKQKLFVYWNRLNRIPLHFHDLNNLNFQSLPIKFCNNRKSKNNIFLVLRFIYNKNF